MTTALRDAIMCDKHMGPVHACLAWVAVAQSLPSRTTRMTHFLLPFIIFRKSSQSIDCCRAHRRVHGVSGSVGYWHDSSEPTAPALTALFLPASANMSSTCLPIASSESVLPAFWATSFIACEQMRASPIRPLQLAATVSVAQCEPPRGAHVGGRGGVTERMCAGHRMHLLEFVSFDGATAIFICDNMRARHVQQKGDRRPKVWVESNGPICLNSCLMPSSLLSSTRPRSPSHWAAVGSSWKRASRSRDFRRVFAADFCASLATSCVPLAPAISASICFSSSVFSAMLPRFAFRCVHRASRWPPRLGSKALAGGCITVFIHHIGTCNLHKPGSRSPSSPVHHPLIVTYAIMHISCIHEMLHMHIYRYNYPEWNRPFRPTYVLCFCLSPPSLNLRRAEYNYTPSKEAYRHDDSMQACRGT